MLLDRVTRRPVSTLLVIEVVVVAALFLSKRYGGQDLEVYLGGARLFLTQGDPYAAAVHTHDGWLPFTYPPFAAAVFVPGTVLSVGTATRLIGLASILAVGAVAYLLVASLNGALRDRGDLRGHTIAAAAAIATQLAGGFLEPMSATLGFGQINALLMLAVTVDALLPGRARSRGLLTGIAAAIKLTPAAFVVFFLLRRDFPAAARTVLGFVGAGVLIWSIAPDASSRYWTQLLLDPGRIGDRGYVGNQSLRGLLARAGLGMTEDAAWIVSVVLVGLLTTAVVVRVAEPASALIACAVGGLLVSPVSWTHHWIWCLPILVLLVYLAVCARHDDRPLALGAALLAVGAAVLFGVAPMWLAPRPANSLGWWLATESFVLFGLLILALGAGYGRRVHRLLDPVPGDHEQNVRDSAADRTVRS